MARYEKEKHLTWSLLFLVYMEKKCLFSRAFVTENEGESVTAVRKNCVSLAFVSLKYGDTNHVRCSSEKTALSAEFTIISLAPVVVLRVLRRRTALWCPHRGKKLS